MGSRHPGVGWSRHATLGSEGHGHATLGSDGHDRTFVLRQAVNVHSPSILERDCTFTACIGISVRLRALKSSVTHPAGGPRTLRAGRRSVPVESDGFAWPHRDGVPIRFHHLDPGQKRFEINLAGATVLLDAVRSEA